jgi:hypothetical protein
MHWLIVALIFCAVPFWRIVKRSGMNPALSLLWLVPVANIIFLWVFAFVEWPALKQEVAR